MQLTDDEKALVLLLATQAGWEPATACRLSRGVLDQPNHVYHYLYRLEREGLVTIDVSGALARLSLTDHGRDYSSTIDPE